MNNRNIILMNLQMQMANLYPILLIEIKPIIIDYSEKNSINLDKLDNNDFINYIINYVKENKLDKFAVMSLKDIINKTQYVQNDFLKIENQFDKAIIILLRNVFAYEYYEKSNKSNGENNTNVLSNLDAIKVIRMYINTDLIRNAVNDIKTEKEKESNPKNPEFYINHLKIALQAAKKNNEFNDINSCKKYLLNLFKISDLYNHINSTIKNPKSAKNYEEFKIYENQILDTLTTFCIVLELSIGKIRNYEEFIMTILFERPGIVNDIF